ncbi:hypothetical protein AB0O34_27650 [Sphaerisporangium sp. NPDC088356]|uniref:hypothetical protein n=1 Tax=Sphaerisporangium sp. NPDC088356 TaxID=3154871 RepID=UPI00342AAF88
MPDHVDIHKSPAHLGISKLSTTTTDLTTLWKERAARLQRLVAASPWGRDSAGSAFQAAYERTGGTDDMVRKGDGIIKDLGDLDGKVRTAVTRTDDTDHGNAATIKSI